MVYMMKEEIKQLRKLAQQYYEQAMSPVNIERMALHRAINDLEMRRPIVLIDEVPWNEMNFDGSLTLQCTDPFFRGVEDAMRKRLFQWKYFPADMILQPFIGVRKVIYNTGMGIEPKENILDTASNGGNIVSHEYIDQLSSPEDVEKIKLPTITYDKEKTMENYTRMAEALGDIIPIKITGHSCGFAPWDNVARFRGVNNLLIDLIDEPEHSHNIISKVFACHEHRLNQLEELDLLELNPYSVHCTSAFCTDLEKSYDGGRVMRKHMWGRGMAQIFSSVSKAMHEEFDINYMMKIMEPFGANYYGCCEPLDTKMDIVEKIPHLRKVSISPWANVDVAAEAIGKKYVLSNKPNPAAVALKLDEEALRKELGRSLAAAKRNDCSIEIVLKDISSSGEDINNLIRWEQIAMEMVKSY